MAIEEIKPKVWKEIQKTINERDELLDNSESDLEDAFIYEATYKTIKKLIK